MNQSLKQTQVQCNKHKNNTEWHKTKETGRHLTADLRLFGFTIYKYQINKYRPVLGTTQPPIQWVPGISRGVKRPGLGDDHPPHLAPRLKKRRAIPLLHIWAFLASYRVSFTFFMCIYIYICMYIQSVPGGMCQTSGGCSLC